MTYKEKIEAISDYINKADDNILDALLLSEDMNNHAIQRKLEILTEALEDVTDEIWKELD